MLNLSADQRLKSCVADAADQHIHISAVWMEHTLLRPRWLRHLSQPTLTGGQRDICANWQTRMFRQLRVHFSVYLCSHGLGKVNNWSIMKLY
jgi:hypothetical protein